MMLQPGVICPTVCFYDAENYTLTNPKNKRKCLAVMKKPPN